MFFVCVCVCATTPLCGLRFSLSLSPLLWCVSACFSKDRLACHTALLFSRDMGDGNNEENDCNERQIREKGGRLNRIECSRDGERAPLNEKTKKRTHRTTQSVVFIIHSLPRPIPHHQNRRGSIERALILSEPFLPFSLFLFKPSSLDTITFSFSILFHTPTQKGAEQNRIRGGAKKKTMYMYTSTTDTAADRDTQTYASTTLLSSFLAFFFFFN